MTWAGIINAEETQTMITAVAVGNGSLRKEEAKRIQRELKRMARPPSDGPRKPATPREMAEQFARIGVRVNIAGGDDG